MRASQLFLPLLIALLAFTQAGCLFRRNRTATRPPVIVAPPSSVPEAPPAIPTPPPVDQPKVSQIPSLPPGAQPPTVTPAPPTRPPRTARRPSTAKPAASSSSSSSTNSTSAQAEPPAPEEPSSTPTEAPLPQLGTLLSPEQQAAYTAAIDAALLRAQTNLAKLDPRRLRSSDRANYLRARSLIQQAQQSRATDLTTAKSLADRADVLALDLARNVR